MPLTVATLPNASSLLPELGRRVNREGFVVCKGLAPHLSTVEVAQESGVVLSIDELLASSGIPNVQVLRPRGTREVGPNQYSGHYGLSSFPLHTDLAHWVIPPRYFLLRCLVGTDDVFTNILPCEPIVEAVGRAVLRKAVFSARRRRAGHSGFVRAMSSHQQVEFFRWDPIFIKPLNHHARDLRDVMLDPIWNKRAIKVLLRQPGDSILIDNWRMLHGRSQVPDPSVARHVERVYFSEIFQ